MTPKLDDATRMAKAMAHPLRGRILAHLNTEGTASPADIARNFSEPIGNVSYHMRILLGLDCVELVDTRQRRGAIEHFYRATQRAMLNDRAWSQLPETSRQALSGHWFHGAINDLAKAVDTGRLASADDLHVSFTKLELDDEAMAELQERLNELLDRATELHERGAASSDGNAPKRATRLVMVHYDAP